MPSPLEIAILVGGGLLAGFVNTLAGGGSFLTVPLLVLVGVPPTVANATNRIGVFAQTLAAVAGFRQEGVPGMRVALRLMPAALIGSWLGALLASSASDEVFGRVFALVMLAMLPVVLRNPAPRAGQPVRQLSRPVEIALYFAIGVYGGAIQAGIGIPLVLALAATSGLDLVRANSVKVVIVAALTAVALAQFIYDGKVLWGHGISLAVGTGLGGYAASRFGARAGERLIRPVMTAAVIGLALRLLFHPSG